MSASPTLSPPPDEFLSFDDWPWDRFDTKANDQDIGHHTLPQLPAIYDDASLNSVWEAPVAIKGSGEGYHSNPKERKPHISGTLWMKWHGYCPCFSSEANLDLEEPLSEDVRMVAYKINTYLARAGYKDSHSLPKGRAVYFSDKFITRWHEEFYKDHPNQSPWKLNCVRRDRGPNGCNCTPSVCGHPELPLFKSPEGLAVHRPGPEYNIPYYFWADPDPDPELESKEEPRSDEV